ALLKNFIENRIRQGESAEEIIRKMQTGFGEEALKDDIVQKFLSLGSEGMARSIVNGFGEKILAEPEPIWINLSIGAAALAGISIIILYFRKNRKNDAGRKMSASESDDLDRILKELKQEK
nr:cytochrome C biogenesis protein [Leptospiraceae bacterium]